MKTNDDTHAMTLTPAALAAARQIDIALEHELLGLLSVDRRLAIAEIIARHHPCECRTIEPKKSESDESAFDVAFDVACNLYDFLHALRGWLQRGEAADKLIPSITAKIGYFDKRMVGEEAETVTTPP